MHTCADSNLLCSTCGRPVCEECMAINFTVIQCRFCKPKTIKVSKKRTAVKDVAADVGELKKVVGMLAKAQAQEMASKREVSKIISHAKPKNRIASLLPILAPGLVIGAVTWGMIELGFFPLADFLPKEYLLIFVAVTILITMFLGWKETSKR